MTAEPSTTPWPPVLGMPATESLTVAFAGFDGAAARLAGVMATPSGRVDQAALILANAELSSVLWFARTAVDQLRARGGWPGGAAGFNRDQDALGHSDLLNGFRWARNHAGHALARAAQHREGGITFPLTYPIRFPPARWAWTPRDQLPEGEHAGADAYDRTLAGQDLAPSIQAMAAWLTTTDRTLGTAGTS